MKKLFMLLILFGAFTIYPITSKAMVETDDEGNSITRDIKEDYFTTMTLPEDDAPDSGSVEPAAPGNVNTSSDLDDPVSSTDIINDNDLITDDLYTTTGSENLELYNATDNSKKDKINLVLVTISSVSGLSLGSIATYLFLKKKR